MSERKDRVEGYLTIIPNLEDEEMKLFQESIIETEQKRSGKYLEKESAYTAQSMYKWEKGYEPEKGFNTAKTVLQNARTECYNRYIKKQYPSVDVHSLEFEQKKNKFLMSAEGIQFSEKMNLIEDFFLMEGYKKALSANPERTIDDEDRLAQVTDLSNAIKVILDRTTKRTLKRAELEEVRSHYENISGRGIPSQKRSGVYGRVLREDGKKSIREKELEKSIQILAAQEKGILTRLDTEQAEGTKSGQEKSFLKIVIDNIKKDTNKKERGIPHVQRELKEIETVYRGVGKVKGIPDEKIEIALDLGIMDSLLTRTGGRKDARTHALRELYGSAKKILEESSKKENQSKPLNYVQVCELEKSYREAVEKGKNEGSTAAATYERIEERAKEVKDLKKDMERNLGNVKGFVFDLPSKSIKETTLSFDACINATHSALDKLKTLKPVFWGSSDTKQAVEAIDIIRGNLRNIIKHLNPNEHHNMNMQALDTIDDKLKKGLSGSEVKQFVKDIIPLLESSVNDPIFLGGIQKRIEAVKQQEAEVALKGGAGPAKQAREAAPKPPPRPAKPSAILYAANAAQRTSTRLSEKVGPDVPASGNPAPPKETPPHPRKPSGNRPA